MAVLAAACLVLGACAATPGRIRPGQSVPALDASGGLALEGYDAVAYFDGGAPQLGQARYSVHWQDAEWRFASPGHRDRFAQSPLSFAPRYGNYCAFAVSRGTTAHGDPTVWAIVDGALYLNNNRFAQELWNQDRPGNIEAADQNWPLIPKTH